MKMLKRSGIKTPQLPAPLRFVIAIRLRIQRYTGIHICFQHDAYVNSNFQIVADKHLKCLNVMVER